MRHPALKLIDHLQLNADTRGEWMPIYFILSVLVKVDPRPPLKDNPVDDVLTRVREAGISDDQFAFRELKRKLYPAWTHYATESA